MQLDYEELIDYQRCPMYYKFKNVLSLSREIPEQMMYKTKLQEVVMHFYYSILNNQPMSKETLRSKWYKEWVSDTDKTVQDVLAKTTTGKKLKNQNNSTTYKILDRIYDEQENLKPIPIIVDSDATVNINGVLFTCPIELVREIKYEESPIIQIVKLYATKNSLDDFIIKSDVKTVFQVYAFRELFKTTEDQILVRNLTGKDYIVNMSSLEFNRFKHVVNETADAIDRKKFFPIVSFQCKTCIYKDICEKYKF